MEKSGEWSDGAGKEEKTPGGAGAYGRSLRWRWEVSWRNWGSNEGEVEPGNDGRKVDIMQAGD